MYQFSLVTVCLNSESTIRNTIDSIKNQTFQDFEYIVVDGGSTDNTLNIVNSYKPYFGERLKVLSEKDRGLYDAMNKGINLSSGKFIGILNSDDIFYNSSVLKKIERFHTVNKIDSSVGNIVVQSNGSIKRIYISKKWSPKNLKYGSMPPHPSIFLKRTLFKKYGLYSLDYRIAADYELLVRFYLKHRISFKYSGITTTKMSAGGLSNTGLKSYKIISNEILKAFRDNQIQCSYLAIKLRFVWKIREVLMSLTWYYFKD